MEVETGSGDDRRAVDRPRELSIRINTDSQEDVIPMTLRFS